ncbi:182 kDa tankyrase-1-binding protein isoform X2 [Alligator sinensis]|uniref:182 kDa tankyrase-1-binding protein isoform X2 n=1 Tax=Alligator sinensis TaxID=38654 RepID=A0A1U7S4Z6_ALLSI|nr:182 kDa tankyrase-1-binding protein isoform X2 [Alligator sinensis]
MHCIHQDSIPASTMAFQPQPLHPPFPCTPSNGSREDGAGQLSGGPESGDTRPKPPVRPKPRVLPKPAVPAKPCTPLPSLGVRNTRTELPSAEKINRLAGPKPYGAGVSSVVKRPAFSLKSSMGEATNGKRGSSPTPGARVLASAVLTAEDLPCIPGEEGRSSSPVMPQAVGLLGTRKVTSPFKVKPVPVATKPERFPGTTVEEILAKMDQPRKEGPLSPDRAWALRSFSSDSGSYFTPKGFTAFWRRASSEEVGESDTTFIFEASRDSLPPEALESKEPPRNELGSLPSSSCPCPSSNGQHLLEPPDGAAESDSDTVPTTRASPASTSCDGDPSGHRRLLSTPGVSLLQICSVPAAAVELPDQTAPGSPSVSANPSQAPGPPYISHELLAQALGFPDALAELPAPGVPGIPASVTPGSPGTPSELQVKVSVSLAQAPGAPDAAAETCPGVSHLLGSPEGPGETSPGSNSPPAPGTPDTPSELLPKVTSSPGSPEAPSQSLTTSSLAEELPRVSQSPGSPEAPTQSPGSPDSLPGPERSSPPLSGDTKPYTGPVELSLPDDERRVQPPQLGLRRSSEGIVQPSAEGLGMEELGGSLAALSQGRGPPSEQSLGGESNWSLSQSFEWAFPSRAPEWGVRKMESSPRSPIKEASDSSISEGGELDGEGLVCPGTAPSPEGSGMGAEELRQGDPSTELGSERGDQPDAGRHTGSTEAPSEVGEIKAEESGSREMVAGKAGEAEATCPGGPTAQRELAVAELKGPGAEGDTLQEEQGTLPVRSALHLTEPLQALEQAEPSTQPCVLFSDTVHLDKAAFSWEDDSTLGLAQAGPALESMEGARLEPGVGDADPLGGSESHSDPCWLEELLASPPPSADDTKRKVVPTPGDSEGSEGLLGWSRKDLHSEFGIGEARQVSDFDWASEPGSGKRDWPSGYGASETEQDRAFGTSKRDWASAYSISEADRQDGVFGVNGKEWASEYKGTEVMGDSSTGHRDWPDTYGLGDGQHQDGDLSTSKPDWTSQYSIGSTDSQGMEFGTGKPNWTSSYGIASGNQQDEEFSSGKPSWTSEYGVRDIGQQDKDFDVGKSGWTSEYAMGDTSQQDKEFSPSKPAWTSEYSESDASQQDKEFSPSKPSWTSEYSVGDSSQQGKEFSPSKPSWTSEYGAGDTSQQDKEFSPSKPSWTSEYGVGDTSQQDKDFGVGKSGWNGNYGVGNTEQKEREFCTGNQDWASKYGLSCTDQESAFCSGSKDQSSIGDSCCLGREPSAEKSGWSGSNLQENKSATSSRDWAVEFSVGGAEHQNQFGIIGTDRDSSIGLSTLNPSSSAGTVGPAELRESQSDWVGEEGIAGPAMPQETGTGQSDWAQDLGLRRLDISSSWGAVGSDDCTEGEVGRTDWVQDPVTSSQNPSDGQRPEGFDMCREEQLDWAQDLSPIFGIGNTVTFSSSQAKGLDKTSEAGVERTDEAGDSGSDVMEQSPDLSLHIEEPSIEDGGDSEDGECCCCEASVGKFLPGPSAADVEDHLVLTQSRGPVGSRLSGPSLLLEEILANSSVQAAQQERPASPQTSHMEEERGLSNTANDQALEAAGPPQPDDADGSCLPKQVKRLSQPECRGSPTERRRPSQGLLPAQDFSFLEDAEVLDSTVSRSKANLGRKRGHRAPAIRPGATLGLSEMEGDSWMFQDSTEPRTTCMASSDEEAAEEPKSRRARPSPASKGAKVSLFPGLNPSAIKAKLRGRNRFAEEGAQPGEGKPASSKELHMQRSKSCKVPGLAGKPPALPPKPEKSSGSETSSPHWLQALKLKKKKS